MRNCPWRNEPENALLVGRLTSYMAMLDAGCPVGRDELTDEQWILLGRLKAERDKWVAEETEERGRRNGSNAPY